MQVFKESFIEHLLLWMCMWNEFIQSLNSTKPDFIKKCYGHRDRRILFIFSGCLGGICTSYPVDPSVAHLQHYRRDCVSTLKKSCERDFKNSSVIDTTIWKFNEPLIKATTEALANLGFFRTYPWKKRAKIFTKPPSISANI